MLKIITITLLAFSLIGCASVKYQDPNGASFSYTRIGKTNIKGLEMTKDEKGVTGFAFKGLDADLGELGKVITEISEKFVVPKMP